MLQWGGQFREVEYRCNLSWVLVWDPNKVIDIGEWAICGGSRFCSSTQATNPTNRYELNNFRIHEDSWTILQIFLSISWCHYSIQATNPTNRYKLTNFRIRENSWGFVRIREDLSSHKFMKPEWVKNTYECLQIYCNSVMMSKNGPQICYELTNYAFFKSWVCWQHFEF